MSERRTYDKAHAMMHASFLIPLSLTLSRSMFGSSVTGTASVQGSISEELIRAPSTARQVILTSQGTPTIQVVHARVLFVTYVRIEDEILNTDN